MDDARNERPARVFRALMHPVRLAILETLRSGPQCVRHVEVLLGLRQAYISQQLAVLRKAGLVEDHRSGPNVYYRVVRPEVYALVDVARTMAESDPAPSAPSSPEGCSCPRCTPSAHGVPVG